MFKMNKLRQAEFEHSLLSLIYKHGGVKVSTGIKKVMKQVVVARQPKKSQLNLNANKNLAYAA